MIPRALYIFIPLLPGKEDDDTREELMEKSLNKNQMYDLLTPLTKRLLESMIKCRATKIETYQQELEILIQRVESCESLLPRKNGSNKIKQEPPEEEKLVVSSELLTICIPLKELSCK